MKSVAVFVAEGFEEIELVTAVDIMRRASLNVATVSITNSRKIVGAHGITMETDITISGLSSNGYDCYLLPGGGKGTENLSSSAELKEILLKAATDGKLIAAICAAPTILAKIGLLTGKKATAYPSMKEAMSGADYCEDKVVVDGQFVTSRGPATAIAFALKLTELLAGRDAAQKVAEGMLYGGAY